MTTCGTGGRNSPSERDKSAELSPEALDSILSLWSFPMGFDVSRLLGQLEKGLDTEAGSCYTNIEETDN